MHFVYHGEVDDLAVSGNFIREGGEHAMHRVEGTDFYFRSYELPEKAIFTYQFAVFGEPMTDPANPQKTGPEGREQSVLATAGWQAPSHLREPEGKRGSIEKLQWKSEQLGNEREVQIYLPPGYGEGDGRYPLLVINDGFRGSAHLRAPSQLQAVSRLQLRARRNVRIATQERFCL